MRHPREEPPINRLSQTWTRSKFYSLRVQENTAKEVQRTYPHISTYKKSSSTSRAPLTLTSTHTKSSPLPPTLSASSSLYTGKESKESPSDTAKPDTHGYVRCQTCDDVWHTYYATAPAAPPHYQGSTTRTSSQRSALTKPPRPS